MDLLVMLQRGDIVLDQLTVSGETSSQAFQPASHRVVKARPRYIGKAVGPPDADRTQPEECSVAEPELDGVRLRRGDRRHAAPHHLIPIDRRGRSTRELAHARVDTVGPGPKAVIADGAITERDQRRWTVLGQ